jgi:hypothetical protein
MQQQQGQQISYPAVGPLAQLDEMAPVFEPVNTPSRVSAQLVPQVTTFLLIAPHIPRSIHPASQRSDSQDQFF